MENLVCRSISLILSLVSPHFAPLPSTNLNMGMQTPTLFTKNVTFPFVNILLESFHYFFFFFIKIHSLLFQKLDPPLYTNMLDNVVYMSVGKVNKLGETSTCFLNSFIYTGKYMISNVMLLFIKLQLQLCWVLILRGIYR